MLNRGADEHKYPTEGKERLSAARLWERVSPPKRTSSFRCALGIKENTFITVTAVEHFSAKSNTFAMDANAKIFVCLLRGDSTVTAFL